MECPRCHAENRDGLRFCEDCGNRLSLTCSQCGGELAPGKPFCGSCGTAVGSQPSARKQNTERLAYHALKGEEWHRAALYLHLAGRRAIAEVRFPSAIGFYEAAIRALDQQGKGADLALKLDVYLEPVPRDTNPANSRRSRSFWTRPRCWPGPSMTPSSWPSCA
jgi:predicted amidophosphoribosyltransferase